MNFIKKIFGAKPVEINSYHDFWKWFADHEQSFFKVVKQGSQIDEKFLDQLMPNLARLHPAFYCLTGMYNDSTAELIITPEGKVEAFLFAEDLVAAAPALPHWRFTALKPATGFDFDMNMGSLRFNAGNLSFYANTDHAYPDEIDLTFVHSDYSENNKDQVSSGIQIFLENALGELAASTQIDSMRFGTGEGQTLIPIAKLPEYLTWREAEFVEKYKHTERQGEDNFSLLKARDEYDMPIFATVNNSLLQWDAKPSHPWMLTVEITYPYDEHGLPEKAAQEVLYALEDELLPLLEEVAGCLYLGRKTNGGSRKFYFACREFREVSRKTDAFARNHPEQEVHFSIYRDKYWMTMDMFNVAP